jgi:hypothetical protein
VRQDATEARAWSGFYLITFFELVGIVERFATVPANQKCGRVVSPSICPYRVRTPGDNSSEIAIVRGANSWHRLAHRDCWVAFALTRSSNHQAPKQREDKQ